MAAARVGATGPRCDGCAHFEGGGRAVEAAFPGLSALSSGDASVRGDDGLCTLRGLYLPGSDRCASFADHQASEAASRSGRPWQRCR